MSKPVSTNAAGRRVVGPSRVFPVEVVALADQAGWDPVHVVKDENGLVTIGGAGVAGAAVAATTHVLTLPVGYRPAGRIALPYSAVSGRADVLTDGSILQVTAGFTFLTFAGTFLAA